MVPAAERIGGADRFAAAAGFGVVGRTFRAASG